jgi:flagellar assembly factor FliW
MPQARTKYFGTLEYREQDVVRFPSGLPAFEDESRFLVIEPPDRAPLAFLQSMRQPELCFLALPVLAIDPQYNLAMTEEDLEALELDTSRQPAIGVEVDCLAIVAVPESGPASANLLAPIVIHRGSRLGVQAIRVDSTYSHQHPVAKQEDVCS